MHGYDAHLLRPRAQGLPVYVDWHDFLIICLDFYSALGVRWMRTWFGMILVRLANCPLENVQTAHPGERFAALASTSAGRTVAYQELVAAGTVGELSPLDDSAGNARIYNIGKS